VKTVKLLIMQFSPVVCYFLLSPDNFLSTLFSNTISTEQIFIHLHTCWCLCLQTHEI